MQWHPLSTTLQQLGYQVIILVPAAKDEYPKGAETPVGAPQESYVNLEWIRKFRLTKTPTLLIFNPRQELIWAHQGVLSSNDSISAIKTVKSWKDQGK